MMPKKTERSAKNALVQIANENRELIELKGQIREKTVPEKKLYEILGDIEEYFDKAEMPSLAFYSGKYAGETLRLLFEYYPEIFSKDRYERLSKSSLKRLVGHTYKGVMAKIETGDIRAGQMVDFLKYVEPYLVDEKKENQDDIPNTRLLFSLKTD